MPIGPSHSGGGSRGGGFSGGSSGSFGHSRGGFSGGFGSGPSIHIHRGPIIVPVGGRSYSVSSGKQALLIICLILTIIASILSVSGFKSFSEQNAAAKLMEQDAKEYAEIIENARNGVSNYYLETFEITQPATKYYDYSNTYGFYYFLSGPSITIRAYPYAVRQDIMYFYLCFTFNDGIHGAIEGETYTYYHENAVKGMSEIELAYTKAYDGDGSWDSINANYKLEKNVDYLETKDARSTGILVGVVSLLFAALFIFFIVLIIKKIKKEGALEVSKKEAEVDEARAKASEAQAKADDARKVASQRNRTCAYCGAKIPDGASKCPGCGASQFKQ